jgi:Na+-translocating ferredoxin:NAD+ oxidoreductase RNF subunit RnfB
MGVVGTTAIFAALLALVLAVLLCIFRSVFHVETDVLVGLIRETLPGANCGACGFPGCDGLAAAIAARDAPPTKCTVSSAEQTKKRAELVGGSAEVVPVRAVLACQGTCSKAKPKGQYTGEKNCRGAKISANGTKACLWGCIGFGDCVAACKFGALSMGKDGLPVIDEAVCVGCGACAGECPNQLIKLLPRARKGAFALCQNRSTKKPQVKKNCTSGCIKCGICQKNCPEQAIKLVNGIPEVDATKCTSCGTCADKCPQKVLTLLDGKKQAKA